MADSQSTPPIKKGYVKQVLSGDAVVLQGPPQPNGPPKELTIYLANVSAPRLAKRPIKEGETSVDEPYAWEAREFLRKKIVGKTVVFVREFIATSGREHGTIYLGGTNPSDSENVTESGLKEGLLEVKPSKQQDEVITKLSQLQEQAKAEKKGRWSDDEPSKHVRNISWNIEDLRAVVDRYSHKPVNAVIEQVRDGSTLRAFLLPSFEYVTVMLSGVKAPTVRSGPEGGAGKSEEFSEQAKFFVESRLLQRDVQIVLESVGANNQAFIGSIIHPRGNIAEFLLREGYAKCVEWSIGQATCGPQALRDAERYAKERKLRLWRNYVAGPTVDRNSFVAKVIEIGLGDTITVHKENGEEAKIYFSSFRPPRRDGATGPPAATADGQLATAPTITTSAAGRQFRPLYDIPFMYEVREFLRKRLIGKSVTVSMDYVQPKSDQYPEKHFATVLYNNHNVAEDLIKRGFGRVIRHKQDDDSRSSHYDALLAAEAQAEKEKKGIWSVSSGDSAELAAHTVRVQELQGDAQRSKQFMPYLQRTSRPEGVVEFVASGSRLRVYVPKETCIITFLLAGINCPRGARTGPGGRSLGESEPFANEALQFTKLTCLQRDVQIEVDSMDKAGGFIGYLFVQIPGGSTINLSEALVEKGLASVHFTADRSPYYNSLISAEKRAKAAKLGIWQNYVEEDPAEVEKKAQANDNVERKVNYKKVLVTEVLAGLRFAAQSFDDGPSIERLMNNLQSELNSNTTQAAPRRGQLAAAKFDNLWHRVRVDGIKNDKAEIYYIDFGNREIVSINQLYALPPQFNAQSPGAKEYQLAFVTTPNDEEYARDAQEAFQRAAFAYPHFYLNFEYKGANVDAVTLYADDPNNSEKKIDIGKELVENGFALVEQRREARFKTLIAEYVEAETSARRSRRNIWQYGDFTGNEI